MRYLKIYAKDLVDGSVRNDDEEEIDEEEIENDDIPDRVYLELHDDKQTPAIVYKAEAFEDAKYKWQVTGDGNQDGSQGSLDHVLVREVARVFIDFNWFSPDEPYNKYLQVFASDFVDDKTPCTVNLHFHDGAGEPREKTLLYETSVDGADTVVSKPTDINNDHMVNSEEGQLVRFSKLFRKLSWNDSK